MERGREGGGRGKEIARREKDGGCEGGTDGEGRREA